MVNEYLRIQHQKRKRQAEAANATANANSTANGQTSNGKVTAPDAVDTSKPTAVFQPKKGRDWTVSVALPGSIIAKYFTSSNNNDKIMLTFSARKAMI